MVAQHGSTSSPAKRIAIENQVFNELMYSDDERSQRPIGYGFGANRSKLYGVGGELRKRGYFASGTSSGVGTATQNNLFGTGAKPKRNDYSTLDTSAEVERLNFAMEAMNETNELMQARIHMQSQQLKMQSKQLQMQSKQMEGLQFQLEQVTSLVTKFGVMLNSPQIDPMGSTRRGVSRPGITATKAQVSAISFFFFLNFFYPHKPCRLVTYKSFMYFIGLYVAFMSHMPSCLLTLFSEDPYLLFISSLSVVVRGLQRLLDNCLKGSNPLKSFCK